MSFNNKVILITGAGSGIGAAAAHHLAKLGGKVALIDRNENGANKVAEEIKKAGSPTPCVIVADVTKDAQRIIDETIKHFGKLDVLINCAGTYTKDNVTNFKLEDFDRILNTNLRSVLILTSLAVPYLEKTKGNVVNISSVTGMRATRNMMTYCVSKAGLDQFTRCSALDLASKGIRVNSINPAGIQTSLAENHGRKQSADHYFAEIAKRYPLRRAGTVDDTSAAIAYLASDSASFLTGVLLSVDGGSLVDGRI